MFKIKKIMEIKPFFSSKYFLWIVLAVPGFFILTDLITEYPFGRRDFKGLMHESGEMAARLLIAALLISPLKLIFPNNRFVQWLARQRRAFGVAAFSFASLHLLIYVLFKSFPAMLNDFNEARIWAGWLAFIIFVPLAATSSNWAVQKLGGKAWQKLHRLVYIAAVAVAIHWLLENNGLQPALVHFTPLVVLEAYRLYRILIRRKALKAAL